MGRPEARHRRVHSKVTVLVLTVTLKGQGLGKGTWGGPCCRVQIVQQRKELCVLLAVWEQGAMTDMEGWWAVGWAQ